VGFVASLFKGILTTLFDNTGNTINSGLNIANTGGDAIRAGNIIRSGHSSIGQKVDTVKLNLKKVGTPTGTWKVVIRRVSDDAIVATSSFDVSTIPTTNTLVTFNLDATRTLVADDRVLIESNGGDASNYVAINGTTTHSANIDRTSMTTTTYVNSTAVSMLMFMEGLN